MLSIESYIEIAKMESKLGLEPNVFQPYDTPPAYNPAYAHLKMSKKKKKGAAVANAMGKTGRQRG